MIPTLKLLAFCSIVLGVLLQGACIIEVSASGADNGDGGSVSEAAKNNNESYSINTPLIGLSGGENTSDTLNALSSYSSEHDPKMEAKRSASGPSVSGTKEYYINPTTNSSNNQQATANATQSSGWIQAAVNAAQSGDYISVPAGTYIENVWIDKTLVLNGAGSDKTIVDGNKKGSVFFIGSNARVTLHGMTIRNGASDFGGGIINFGELTVTDSTLSGNTAKTSGCGIYSIRTATIRGCTLNANTAKYGGGISNDNELAIQGGSSLTGNNADSLGGGLFNTGIAEVTSSSISGNSAQSNGGGIYSNGKVTITGSTINANNAHDGEGGGIGNDGTVTVQSGSTISENTAYDGGGIINKGTVTISSSSMAENIAKNDGGCIANYGYQSGGNWIQPILQVTDSTISKNKAVYGGAIYNWQSKSTVQASIISQNYASQGGGILNFNDLTVKGGVLSGNTAQSNGGGVYNLGTAIITGGSVDANTANYGGGIANDGIATMQGGCTISGNYASILGGGLFNTGSASLIGSSLLRNTAKTSGGGIYSKQGSSTTIQGASIIYSNNAVYGGGIDNDGTMTLRDITASGNNAYLGGGILNSGNVFLGGMIQIMNNIATNGVGGGIYSTISSVTFDGTNAAVKSNKAHYPSPELKWYQGLGVYFENGIPITTGGFNPSTQVIYNTLDDTGLVKLCLRAANQQFVCAEGGGGQALVANRNWAQAWETFDLIDLGNNKVALKAYNGQFVCAEGGGGQALVANRNAVLEWETFVRSSP
ncbi:Uncharacterised protein [uncultured archaeon]|nr:Uncharacterised protein [uncultured archaeon]